LEALSKHIMHLGTNGVGVGGAGLLKELEKVEAVPKIEMIEVEKADEIEEMGRTEGIGEPEHGMSLRLRTAKGINSNSMTQPGGAAPCY
jgi:hypothetical protein